jgi:hypothetical protein
MIGAWRRRSSGLRSTSRCGLSSGKSVSSKSCEPARERSWQRLRSSRRSSASEGSGVLAVAGAVSAVATIGVGVSILLPNRRLEFATSGTVVFEHFMRVDLGIREAYRALAEPGID